MRACDGRFAESEDSHLFASYDEVEKCEFIKANAPKDTWEAWSSTDDDDAGLLVKADALRAQARELLVSMPRVLHISSFYRIFSHIRPHLPPSPPLVLLTGARRAPCGEAGA